MTQALPVDLTPFTVSGTPRLWFRIRGGQPYGRDHVHKLISSWPGWRRMPLPLEGRSVYVAPPWPSSLIGIRETPSTSLTWNGEAIALRDRILQAEGDVQRILQGGQQTFPARWPTQRHPLPHQRQALEALFMLTPRVSPEEPLELRGLLADDMGLGKTSTALWAAWRSEARRIIVICPASVKRNWVREIELTLGESWKIVLYGGTHKQRATRMTEVTWAVKGGGDTFKVAFIINYDLLRHLPDQHAETLRAFATGSCLIADEAHALKNPKSQRTKLVRNLCAEARHRLLLTGTPVRNLVDDLYSQVEIIRPKTWTSYSDFEKRYLHVELVNFGARKVRKAVGDKNVDSLNKIMRSVMIRRHKTDVVDLPPKTYTHTTLGLCDVTEPIYKILKKEARTAISELEPGLSIFDPRAKTALEMVMRCEQVAQGFVGGLPPEITQKFSGALIRKAEKIDNRPGELVFPTAPKLRWLWETVEDLRCQHSPCVVFSRFHAPMAWFAKELEADGVRFAWLHGALSSDQKTAEIARFQDGDADVMLCQVRMAEGFNLVRSQDVLFLGRDWSPAANTQAEDRCHRIGQKGTVNIQIPLVDETVELYIDRRLQAKAASARQALSTATLGEIAEAL